MIRDVNEKTNTTSIDELQKRISNEQRAILDAVWASIKETGLGLAERTLLHTYSRETLVAATNALGGDVIITGFTENKQRYNLQLVGIFLTSDGPRLEGLMKKYLCLLRRLYEKNPDIEGVGSTELEALPAEDDPDQTLFSASELIELRHILHRSQGAFASRLGGWSATDWSLVVDDAVADLKRVDDLDRYIKSEITKHYDARQPVGEADRIRYSGILAPNAFQEALAQLGRQPTTAEPDLDVVFLGESPLRGIIESDWREIQVLVSVHAWKSCIILSAGILEGLLLWKLEQHAESAQPRADEPVDYSEFTLSRLLRLCRERDLLAPEAALLSDWTRTYRNVVHPGNQRRELRTVQREHAIVAINLARIIAESFRTQAS